MENRENLEYQIQMLIYLVDANLRIGLKIHGYIAQNNTGVIPAKKTRKINFLKLTACNSFFESVGILHTLLHSTNDKEINFYSWKKFCKDPKHITELIGIEKKFTDNDFHKIRHNQIGHKNKKVEKDPLDRAHSLIKTPVLESLTDIIVGLRELANKAFYPSWAVRNPLNSHIKGMDEILDQINK